MNPEVASRVAADAAAATLATRDGGDAEARVARALGDAQHAVTYVPWSRDPRAGAPACTIAVAVWDGERVVVANVGDSRVYWLGADAAVLLTEDHSWLQEQLDLGARAPLYAASLVTTGVVPWGATLALTVWAAIAGLVGSIASGSYAPAVPSRSR